MSYTCPTNRGIKNMSKRLTEFNRRKISYKAIANLNKQEWSDLLARAKAENAANIRPIIQFEARPGYLFKGATDEHR